MTFYVKKSSKKRQTIKISLLMNVLALMVTFSFSKRWAVLMAGSSGYKNYRHQADVFQTYQILKSRGFDPDRTILFAFDDISHDSSNPFPGKVFNIRKHINVRPNPKEIKYSGINVTAENLIRVLTGDKKSTGPVLESTKDDDVYIFYNDHGTRGLLCVPHGNGRHITAEDLKQSILIMKKKQMFRKLFIVIEACYSGSVGKVLDGIEDVAIITAANSIQSSYSHGYDEDINSFRTNEFTNSLHRFVLHYPNATIGQLFNYTKTYVYGSDVFYFGDKKMKNEKISLFLGDSEPLDLNFENSVLFESYPTVSSMDTEITYLHEKALRSINPDERKKALEILYQEKKRRNHSKEILSKIIAPFSGQNAKDIASEFPENPKWKCYDNTIEEFRSKCGDFGEYELKRVSMFAKLCNDHEESEIINRINKICPVKQWVLANY